jgi:hypothetical protein
MPNGMTRALSVMTGALSVMTGALSVMTGALSVMTGLDPVISRSGMPQRVAGTGHNEGAGMATTVKA